ncbi:hypothetical protein BKA69DRAFT_303873 [Paraphysoderma sedebokerense]|nr:hypothetical protein BKA69DRAFT_303873 [Paraphysoderma sedebokerense]
MSSRFILFLIISSLTIIYALPQASFETVCQGNVATAFGTDGRLFGYENGQSCVIADRKKAVTTAPLTLQSFLTNSKAPSGPVTSPPICTQNVITTIGGDGRRWGWENDKSCLIVT